MKKKILLLISLLALTSCNQTTQSSDISSNNDSIIDSSSININEDSNLENAIDLLQSTNISFKTTCKLIYEPKTSSVDEYINTFGVRYNYYDYEKFEFKGYTNDALVASYIYYANSEKYAVTATLNLMNEVKEEYLTHLENGNYYKIPWGQSTYYNLFKDLSSSMFIKVDDYTYKFNSTLDYDIETISLLVYTLTGSSKSAFTYDSVYLNLDNNYQFKNITFIDKGSNDNPDYHEYYQYICELNSINDVVINIPKSYEHNVNVEPLQNKINALKKSSSYKVTLNQYDINYINNNYDISKTISKSDTNLINSSDIYVSSTQNNITTLSGYHTHDDGYGYFEGDENSLTEYYFNKSSSISDLVNLFNFSADLFYLDEKTSTNDIKVYKLHDNSYMSNVISEFYYEDYTSLYSYLSEIQLILNGDNLYIYFDIDANSKYTYLEFIYSDINSTSIDDSLFNNYIKYQAVTSFNDDRLKFDFENEYNDKFIDTSMSFDTFFTTALGSNYDVPLYEGFNPYMDKYYGGITYENEVSNTSVAPKYADISIILYDNSYLSSYEETLSSLKFKLSYNDVTGMGQNYIYTKGDLIIGFTIDRQNGVYGIGYSVLSDNFLK